MDTLRAWLLDFGSVTLLALVLGLAFGYAIGRLQNPAPIKWLDEEDPDPIPLPDMSNVIELRSRRAS